MRVPAECKDGDSVRQKLNEIIRYLRSIPQSPIPQRKLVKRSGGGAFPPFHVILLTETVGETTSYKVKVMPGYVVETIPGPNDALQYHEPANLWDESDGTKLAEFSISTDQAVYVSVSVKEDGTIGAAGEGDAVTIVVDANNAESTHYEPKVDDESSDGVSGTMKYKLATLTAGTGGGAAAVLKRFASGSHIYHHQLTSMKSTGTGADVIKAWNNDEAKIEVRKIKGRYGIVQEKNEQVDLDLDLENIGGGAASVWFEPTTAGEDAKAQFRTLRDMSTAEITAEAAGLPTGVTFTASAVQIEMKEAASEAGSGIMKTIRLRGNANHGVLKFVTDTGTPLGEVKWEDGAWANSGVVTITIPTGGGQQY